MNLLAAHCELDWLPKHNVFTGKEKEEEDSRRPSNCRQHAYHHRLSCWAAFSIPPGGGNQAHDGESTGSSVQHGGQYGGKPAPVATWHQMVGPLCWHW